MDSWNELRQAEIESEQEEVYNPRPRKEVKEPVTKYDYCEKFADIIGFPVGKVLKDTKGWPIEWLYEIDSYLKSYRDTETEAKRKYINWMLKGRAKEIQ